MTVSIIITSYNYDKYIAETIKSVIAQSVSDWELIIVDDYSSDNSVKIIKTFLNDKRIKLICHEKNLGLKESIKTALKEAAGEWVAFLESDDTWNEDTLKYRLEIASKYHDVGIIFNDTNEFGDKIAVKKSEKFLSKLRKILSKKTFPKNIFKDINIYNLIFTFSSVMIKREKLKNLNLNTPIDAILDWWIYIHIAYDTKAFYIPEKLTNWRQHEKSYLKNHKRTFRFVNLEAYLDMFKHNKLGFSFVLFFIKTCVLTVFKAIGMKIERLKN